MTEHNLKPCPFCKGKARLELRWNGSTNPPSNPTVHIVCTECGCIGKGYNPETIGPPDADSTCAQLAANWWNMRLDNES